MRLFAWRNSFPRTFSAYFRVALIVTVFSNVEA